MRVKRILYTGLTCLLIILLTAYAAWTDLDLIVALHFFRDGTWPGFETFPWDFIYKYAAIPGFLLAGVGMVIFLEGFVIGLFAEYRKQSLFVVLLFVLGPGLVVNLMLKDNLGRARPHEVAMFGGEFQFTQPWEKGEVDIRNSSFPSGHAAAAFYLMAPWFVFRRKNKPPALVFLFGGIGYGSLVGMTRILQGGHFLTDIIWAGFLVYLCGEILALLLGLDNPQPAREIRDKI